MFSIFLIVANIWKYKDAIHFNFFNFRLNIFTEIYKDSLCGSSSTQNNLNIRRKTYHNSRVDRVTEAGMFTSEVLTQPFHRPAILRRFINPFASFVTARTAFEHNGAVQLLRIHLY